MFKKFLLTMGILFSLTVIAQAEPIGNAPTGPLGTIGQSDYVGYRSTMVPTDLSFATQTVRVLKGPVVVRGVAFSTNSAASTGDFLSCTDLYTSTIASPSNTLLNNTTAYAKPEVIRFYNSKQFSVAISTLVASFSNGSVGHGAPIDMGPPHRFDSGATCHLSVGGYPWYRLDFWQELQ